MMISEQERQDVIDGLFSLTPSNGRFPIGYVLNELGVPVEDGTVSVYGVVRIAQLIARDTCRNVSPSQNIGTFDQWFECSDCHCMAKLGYVGHDLKYCPHCGRVVRPLVSDGGE